MRVLCVRERVCACVCERECVCVRERERERERETNTSYTHIDTNAHAKSRVHAHTHTHTCQVTHAVVPNAALGGVGALWCRSATEWIAVGHLVVVARTSICVGVPYHQRLPAE